ILSQSAANAYAKIAIIGKELTESNESREIAYADASQFLSKAKDAASFDETARQMGVSVVPASNILKNTELISGVGSSKDLAEWVYSGNVGDVSKTRFTIGRKSVIAKLTSVQEKGKIELNDENRESADILVKREKKGKMIMDKNNSQTSLDAVASANNQ